MIPYCCKGFMKHCIVFLAVYGYLSPEMAHWLIKATGLVHD